MATPESSSHIANRSDRSRPRLDVRLFGAFEVQVDGRAIRRWNGQLGPSIFRYLLMAPGRSCSRDQLLEAFWPGADPHRTKNRLQAALSSLRSSFRQAITAPIVEYTDGRYAVTDAVEVILDTERFDLAIDRAGRALRSGDTEMAIRCLRQAVHLHRSELASDIPYDEWVLVPREHYRIRYVDALDLLSRLELEAGDLDGCVATCHLLLEMDPCREDVHRLLMDIYALQGRRHQIGRQFQFCRRALRTVLGLEPSAETVALYRELHTTEREG